MTVKYFRDTDTALLEFADRPVEETREIAVNVVDDLDKAGNLVSMPIEHAARRCIPVGHHVRRDRRGRRMTCG